jgi:hypothetical protein
MVATSQDTSFCRVCLIEKYLFIVRPLEMDLAYHVGGKDARLLYDEYMWVQNCRRMTAEDMYQAIPDFLLDYCGAKDIGAREYRQLCVEIGRIFLGSEFQVRLEEMDVLAMQSGHSVMMARQEYAAEAGHLSGMSSDLLLRFGRISEVWWQVLGLLPNTPPMLPLRQRYSAMAKTHTALLAEVASLKN